MVDTQCRHIPREYWQPPGSCTAANRECITSPTRTRLLRYHKERIHVRFATVNVAQKKQLRQILPGIMVAGFSIPLYLVLIAIGGVASSLLLPYPLYKPSVALCVFTGHNVMARTVINTMTAFLTLMMVAPVYEYWNVRCSTPPWC